jgi:YjbE family integral membrane protein
MILLSNFIALLQILLIDFSLAGDNAIAVGMAAAGLPAPKRRQAVIVGVAVATILRILFAIFSVKILHITGLLLAGGLLLLWVAWKMYVELRNFRPSPFDPLPASGRAPTDKTNLTHKTLSGVIARIALADVSMSLDNVLAVAGVARDKLWILAIGLSLSVVLMGIAASVVARLMGRHRWIGYVGLATVLFTALHMIWDGRQDFMGIF